MPVKENPPGAAWVVVPVFAAAGLGIMALGAFVMFARDVIREESGALVFSSEALGRHWLPRRIEKREVEEITLRDPTRLSGGSTVRVGGITAGGRAAAPRQEVLVRSDRAARRIGGELNEAEREWLRNTLPAMTAG